MKIDMGNPPKTDLVATASAAAINGEVRVNFGHWTPQGVIIRFTDVDDPMAPAAWFNSDVNDIFVNVPALATMLGETTRQTARRLNGEFMALRMVADQAIVGVLMHELAHSAWSTWGRDSRLDEHPRQIFSVLQMFEELRVERMALDHAGRHRPAIHPAVCLPAGFKYLVKQIIEQLDVSDPSNVAFTWALTVGRALAGTVKWSAVSKVDELTRTLIGDDEVDYLHEILDEAVSLDVDRAGALDRYIELAYEWLETAGAAEPQDGDGEGEGQSQDGEGQGKGKGGCGTQTGQDPGEKASRGEGEDGDGEGDGSGDGDGSDDAEAGGKRKISHGYTPPSDAMQQLLEQALEDASDEAIEVTDTGRKPMNPMEVAPRVFNEKKLKQAKAGDSYGWKVSQPTPRTLLAVKELARELEQIAVPQLIKSKTTSTLPPGRLHTREAVRRSAEISRGQMVTATPWKTTKRRHTTAKPLVVGIMTDTSGSMGWAEQMVAEAAYVFSHAGQRIGARTAAVTFGDRAEAVVGPTEIPTEIRRRAANGGSEAFDEGAAAMDGVLNLSYADGAAKFVVVVSDGYLVAPGEIPVAQEWIKRWHAAGTRVLWAAPHHGHHGWLDATAATTVNLDRTAVAGDALALVKLIAPSFGKAMRPS